MANAHMIMKKFNVQNYELLSQLNMEHWKYIISDRAQLYSEIIWCQNYAKKHNQLFSLNVIKILYKKYKKITSKQYFIDYIASNENKENKRTTDYIYLSSPPVEELKIKYFFRIYQDIHEKNINLVKFIRYICEFCDEHKKKTQLYSDDDNSTKLPSYMQHIPGRIFAPYLVEGYTWRSPVGGSVSQAINKLHKEVGDEYGFTYVNGWLKPPKEAHDLYDFLNDLENYEQPAFVADKENRKLYLTLNLNMNDKTLIDEFKKILKTKRKNNFNFTKGNFENMKKILIEYKVLEYIDLRMMLDIFNCKLTNVEIGDILFPGDLEKFFDEKIKKTTKKYASNIINTWGYIFK